MNCWTIAEPPIARIGNFQPVLPNGRTGIEKAACSAPDCVALSCAEAVLDRMAAPVPARTLDFKKPRRSRPCSARRIGAFDMIIAPMVELFDQRLVVGDRSLRRCRNTTG